MSLADLQVGAWFFWFFVCVFVVGGHGEKYLEIHLLFSVLKDWQGPLWELLNYVNQP